MMEARKIAKAEMTLIRLTERARPAIAEDRKRASPKEKANIDRAIGQLVADQKKGRTSVRRIVIGTDIRVGAVKSRSQLKNPITGTWTKRDQKLGKFLDVKADPKPFKGVRKTKGR